MVGNPNTAHEAKPAPWADLFRDGRGVYTVSLLLGIALHATDAFVVSTVMPTVVDDIGGTPFYAWVVMLYMTASILGAASGGPVKLMFGARRGYVAAGLLFLAGTMISAMAPSTHRVASRTERVSLPLMVCWPASRAILATLSELPRIDANYLKNKR